MGNEAAAVAAAEAERAKELIHYLAWDAYPGVTLHMQNMYMTWIVMILLILLFQKMILLF